MPRVCARPLLIAIALYTLVLLATGGAAAGCTSRSDAPAVAIVTPLEDTPWKLVAVGGKAIEAGAAEEGPYIRFTAADHRVEGSTGCNLMTGGYTLDAAGLKLSPLATTRRYCEATAAVEQAFLAALAAVDGYRIDGHWLVLVGDGKALATLEAS